MELLAEEVYNSVKWVAFAGGCGTLYLIPGRPIFIPTRRIEADGRLR